MSSVEYLREFVNERLTVAAEEIFGVFKQTIFEYEEEINRQRRLLEVIWKPEIKIHRIELPQQYTVCKEEEKALADQQLCVQGRNSSLDQEQPEHPQIKEEQGELLDLEETDYEENHHSEDETLNFSINTNQSAVAEKHLSYISVVSSVLQQPSNDQQLLPHNSHVSESQYQRGGKHGDSESTGNAEPKQQNQPHKSNSHIDSVYNPTVTTTHCISEVKNSFKCDVCEKAFKYKSFLQRHMIIHTGEKPHSCNTCGKRFSRTSILNAHMRTHTGQKPYSCDTCGKTFSQMSTLSAHRRIHTGEKPYSCNTCGKRFSRTSLLNAHSTVHTGERPHSCETCGKRFSRPSLLNAHLTVHTGEKPYPCNTCGKSFSRTKHLNAHLRVHTGEKPYTCKICGERFSWTSQLRNHRNVHTGEKP